jgi:hypothetical protein
MLRILCAFTSPVTIFEIVRRSHTSTMSRRGAFIVIEGLDRSGKSTQADLLTKKLQGLGQAKLLKFPGLFPVLYFRSSMLIRTIQTGRLPSGR